MLNHDLGLLGGVALLALIGAGMWRSHGKKEAAEASSGSPSLDDIFKGFLEAEQRAESERAFLAKSRADSTEGSAEETPRARSKESRAEAEIRAATKPEEDYLVESFCPDCKTRVPPDAVKCPNCGAHFETEEIEVFQCPSCGGTVHESDPKCPHCNVTFDEEEAPAQAPAEEAQGEDAEVYDEEPEMELGAGADENVAINPKDELKTMLAPWQTEGYDLGYFNKMIESDPQAARKEVMIFVSRARELSALEKRIKKIGAVKLDKALLDLKRDVTSPDKSKRGGIEWSILELRGRVKQVAKMKGDEANEKKVVLKKKKKL